MQQAFRMEGCRSGGTFWNRSRTVGTLERNDAKCLCNNAHSGSSIYDDTAGSGANALDRGMEALAHAYIAQTIYHNKQTFIDTLDGTSTKRISTKPIVSFLVGIGLVICCGTFPTWNAYPSILASLCTGNPVVVKPHPNGVYQWL